MVDRSLRPADGDVIIASVEISPERSEHCEAMSLEGCDFTVKTLRLGNGEWGTGNGMRGNGERGMGNGGEVRLVAANPKYPDIVLKPGQELDYFGKATACIHQFKKGNRNG